MNKSNCGYLLLIGLVAIGLSVSVIGWPRPIPSPLQGSPPEAPPGPPAPGSRALLPEDISLAYPGSIYQGIAVAGVGQRGMSFEWRYKPSTPGGVDVSTKIEHFATPFIPTAFAVTDSSVVTPTSPLRLFVAGRGDRGDTIIEEWQFNRVGPNAPQVSQVIGSASGVVTYKWKVPARSASKELFRTRVPALDTVMWILANHADPNFIFVQFWSSRSIYSIRTTDGAFSLVASPSQSGPGILTVPQLNQEFYTYWAADRTGHGIVYILGRHGRGIPLDVQAVVLADGNRDGTIDTCTSLSAAQWASQGWKDPASYLRYFR